VLKTQWLILKSKFKKNTSKKRVNEEFIQIQIH